MPGSIDRIVAARVEVPPYLAAEWEAFWELNIRRSVDMFGVSALKFSEIEAYCRLYGYTGEDAEYLVWVINVLDREYLLWRKESVEKDKKQQTLEKERDDNSKRHPRMET